MNNDSIDSRAGDLNKENFKKLSPRAHENNRFKNAQVKNANFAEAKYQGGKEALVSFEVVDSG